MQFLSRLSVFLGLLIFNIHYKAITNFVNIGLFISLKLSLCKEISTVKAGLHFKTNPFKLSQASPNTLRGEDSYLDEYGESTTDSYVEDFIRRKDVEIEEDEEIQEEKDPYDSLCFLEFPELGEPVQIVYPNEDHTELLVDYEGLKVLDKIPKPVYPVAFIGSVNTGKSFLLNLVNDNHFCNACPRRKKSEESEKETHKYFENGTIKRLKAEGRDYENPKGFKVANSPEPETMGIWVYSEPLLISKKKLQEKLNKTEENSNIQLYSLKKVKNNKESNENLRLSRLEYEGKEEEGTGEMVNVVLFDVEGFNNQNNIFKYDEALFSIVSTICSEIVYLSNKTLNTSDLQMVEELIKSSVLSKIANLYTTYTEMGEFRDDREEVFQYFLKMFETKNLTFLINEFNYTSEQALENLVNLLKSPKRDLSMHELYMYHSKNKLALREKEKSEYLTKKIKLQNKEKVELDEIKEKEALVELKNVNICKSTQWEMEDVMFTSFGYIFHMLFNSVNIAVLPSTSKNPFAQGFEVVKKEAKTEQKEIWNMQQEYIEQLRNFKSELFKRSTKKQLEKYCILDGVKSTCNMTGKDVGEMIKFTLKTLSINKYYRLATTIGEVEGLDKLKYRDAFDEFFKVFRSTRLLMIKNDLYETYKVILKKYIQGEVKEEDSKRKLKRIKNEQIPTTEMFKEYSKELKEKLLNLLVKNYENETFTENFNKIKNDMLQGFDKLAETSMEELKEKITEKCTDVSEILFKKFSNKVESLKLPVVPSRLKFVLELPKEYKSNFRRWIDKGELEKENKEEEEIEEEGVVVEDKMVEGRKEQLSYDRVCYEIFEEYEVKLKNYNEEIIRKNEQLIDKHFKRVLNKAIKNFKSKFVEDEENYELPLQETLKKTSMFVKQSENIMLAHLGEFHAIEYLVDEYKQKLMSKLDEQIETFKENYDKKCKEQVIKIKSHYLDNYKEFLQGYTKYPMNPETLYKYNEFIQNLAEKEFVKIKCIDTLTKHQLQRMLRIEINKKYKEVQKENIKAVAEGLEAEFMHMDQYLKSQLPSCTFYHYFKYNAMRYANYKITQKLIYDKLNLEKITDNPVNTIPYKDVMLNSEVEVPYESLEPNLNILSEMDFRELNTKYLTVNKNKLQKKFVQGVIKYYMENNVKQFKKHFFQKHCNSVVLVCSFILLGLSSLSFMLAQHWAPKLFFSLLGFTSYAFMVGLNRTKQRLRILAKVLKTMALGLLLGLLKVLKYSLRQLIHFVVTGLTMTMLKMPGAKYYTFGLISATILYLLIRLQFYRIKKLKLKNQNKNK